MQQESKKNKAYNYIKEKIYSCELMPGDFIDEKQLIDQIGASRTPIREALNKIEQENLIHIIPKKGIMVKHLTAKNVVDIFQLREMIETYCVLHYGHLLDKTIAAEFAELFSKEEPFDQSQASLDDRFHLYVTSSCNNDYVTSILRDIYGQNNRIRVLTGHVVSDCSQTAKKEHLKVVSCILEDDYKGAAEALRTHLILSKDRTMSIFIGTH